jgi:hypothetical protein
MRSACAASPRANKGYAGKGLAQRITVSSMSFGTQCVGELGFLGPVLIGRAGLNRRATDLIFFRR